MLWLKYLQRSLIVWGRVNLSHAESNKSLVKKAKVNFIPVTDLSACNHDSSRTANQVWGSELPGFSLSLSLSAPIGIYFRTNLPCPPDIPGNYWTFVWDEWMEQTDIRQHEEQGMNKASPKLSRHKVVQTQKKWYTRKLFYIHHLTISMTSSPTFLP